jgi:hypothetical protein
MLLRLCRNVSPGLFAVVPPCLPPARHGRLTVLSATRSCLSSTAAVARGLPAPCASTRAGDKHDLHPATTTVAPAPEPTPLPAPEEVVRAVQELCSLFGRGFDPPKDHVATVLTLVWRLYGGGSPVGRLPVEATNAGARVPASASASASASGGTSGVVGASASAPASVGAGAGAASVSAGAGAGVASSTVGGGAFPVSPDAQRGCRVLAPVLKDFAVFGAHLDAPLAQMLVALHVRAGEFGAAGWLVRHLPQWRVQPDPPLLAYFLHACTQGGWSEEAIRTCGTWVSCLLLACAQGWHGIACDGD